MKELKEIKFNDSTVLLKDNRVSSAILPQRMSELTRNVTIESNCIVEGALFANKLELKSGDAEIRGAVFTSLELFVNSDATGNITFTKSVASAESIVSRARKANLVFGSDINAKRIALCNAFVCGSIFADEIELDNCVVIGGVFGSINTNLKNCMVATFNSPSVQLGGNIFLLLPSAFSVEKVAAAPDTVMANLSLADLGSLYRGMPQDANSGKILIDIEKDEIKTVLTDENLQRTIRSYSVIGKVLAADLIDTDKFQNHFLLATASLGSQLLKTYSFGEDAAGNEVSLTRDGIREFMFNILAGRVDIKTLSGDFDISEITNSFS